MNKFVPIFSPHNNNNTKRSVPNWFNSELKSLTNTKYRLFSSMRAGNADPAVASDYRSTCKQVKMLVNRSRSSFEAGLAANAKRNPKGVYAYIKRQCISRDTVSSMYNVDRALVTDKQEVACVLNKQFHSVFTSDTNSHRQAVNTRQRVLLPQCAPTTLSAQ